MALPVLPGSLPLAIREKLTAILQNKAKRAGNLCLPFDTSKFPLDIRTQFPAYARYALEIGCGWGEFTRASALQHPETLVIALEKKLARVIASGREQEQAELKNIRYMVLDIAWFFEGIFAPAQFDQVTINFPDPWPKARHHKHRFISPDFAAILAEYTRPEGMLMFATDNYAYAREAMQVFENHANWQNLVAPFIALPEIAGRPRSFFESVHRAEGAPIYFLQYVRQ